MPRYRLLSYALGFALLPVVALANQYRLGALQIDSPWARATAPTAPTGGGYLTIVNTGAAPDRLIAASCPEAANRTQIHEMKMDGTVMRMREVEHGLEIAPGATTLLAPGGYHLMMTGLKAPLLKGGKIACTLTFEKAGQIGVELTIESLGATHPGS